MRMAYRTGSRTIQIRRSGFPAQMPADREGVIQHRQRFLFDKIRLHRGNVFQLALKMVELLERNARVVGPLAAEGWVVESAGEFSAVDKPASPRTTQAAKIWAIRVMGSSLPGIHCWAAIS